MIAIVQKDSPVLRKVAKTLTAAEIKGAKIQQLIAEMHKALANEYDGVGLAAPQVGESLRLFVISELVFKHVKTAKTKKSVHPEDIANEHLVFINPEIVSSSKDKKNLEEGCLSVRPMYGQVRRASKVTIRAHDEHGKLFERGASGLLAQVFQHEIDHLNGILFIDTAKNVHEMPPEAD